MCVLLSFVIMCVLLSYSTMIFFHHGQVIDSVRGGLSGSQLKNR
jgi:hypothetical protein